MSHILLMITYAAIVGIFFALLWQPRPEQDAGATAKQQRIVLFLKIFLGMVLGALAVAWLIYAFPSGPPAPLP